MAWKAVARGGLFRRPDLLYQRPMSASAAPEIDAIALQLLAALDQYDRDTVAMIATWPDLERYRDVSDQVEKIRMYSSAMPELRVQWVEVLITHAELVHFLWRVHYGEGEASIEQIPQVREHHADAVAALRNRCQRLMARSRLRHAAGAARSGSG